MRQAERMAMWAWLIARSLAEAGYVRATVPRVPPHCQRRRGWRPGGPRPKGRSVAAPEASSDDDA